LLAVINPTNDLPYTPAEGVTIANLFEVQAQTILSNDEATHQKVQAAIKTQTHFHFSCHGFHQWRQAMESGLKLAGKDELTLSTILGELDLTQSRLVVLSACETGLTDIRQPPDEYLSLPAGFLHAGAVGVVSSLWPVSDVSTALLMGKFYEYHLVAHQSPAQALRQAQMWLRDLHKVDLEEIFEDHQQMMAGQAETSKFISRLRRYVTMKTTSDYPFAHPHYWAAFTFAGI
jgi:CHAT domain-containing protein